ncbi:DUF5689 domain-containing protein [Hanstruepera ponticola]|uniref:DUF5689 domain-containing protein n=1 Tax=Hanstruepera ponticola TaxID=2042995 RepID=UPI000CF05084|nr:DUF5689 domain-containing protein [Hanstruepera ponticola]
MKTNRFFTIVLGLIATIAITSCVQDDDYTVPESLGDEENIGLNNLIANSTAITVSEAKSYFVPGEVTAITTNVYVKGYVSSSDRTGNFYKEFFIQDSPSNPTAAIKVVLNQVDSYNQFNFGREVYINLNGLVIGEVRGGDDVIAIGGTGNSDGEVEQITGNRVPSKIFRSQVTETMEPLVVTFSQVNDSHIGMYVMVENAQFPDSLEGEFYVDPFDDFDTSRTIQSCDGFGYSSFPLETSSFADFAQLPLPTSGGGTIAGVITKTFNGSNLVMALNTTDDVKFDQAKCEPLDIDEFDIIFEEDFVGGLNGWDVITTEGTREWYATSFGGVSYIRGSAYNGSSGEPMISWLISPSFDFDAQEDEQMILEIADAFSDAGEEPLKAYFSNDYVAGADPTTATWTEIGQTEIEALPINGGFFDNEYDVTGLIDLSEASGNGFIAFVYDSNGGAISSTRDLSNVKILAPQ